MHCWPSFDCGGSPLLDCSPVRASDRLADAHRGKGHSGRTDHLLAVPELAIVEISPCGGDGLELVKRMRAGWPKVLVLVLSMHSERLYAERALRAGARGYKMKEESPKTVMAAIRRILAGGVHVSESVQSMLVERVASGRNTSGRASVEILSNRELDVLRLIGSGFGTRRIAEHLQRSVKTISPIGRTSRTNWASRAPLSWSSMPRFGCTNIQSVNT